MYVTTEAVAGPAPAADSVHALPVSQPQPDPHPGSIAIAQGILDAGYGPEKIPGIVEGFRCAAELEEEITTAMAALLSVPARVPFPQMTPAELAKFWAAVRMLRAERALHESAAAGSAALPGFIPSQLADLAGIRDEVRADMGASVSGPAS